MCAIYFWGITLSPKFEHKITYLPPNYRRLSHEKYGLMKGVGRFIMYERIQEDYDYIDWMGVNEKNKICVS